MDAIAYAHADKQQQRIKKLIAQPDSVSGLVTMPSVVATGEVISIPTGRTVVHPNLQVDGILDVQGTLFIPSGGSVSTTEVDATVVKQNGNVVANDSTVVHKTGNETKTGTMTFMGNVGIGGTPTFQLDLKGGTTVNYRLNASRGNDDVSQGVRFGFGGIDTYRTSVPLSEPQTELNFTQTASDATRTPLKIDSSGNVLVTGSGGLGYGADSGGTVTQLTSKSTAVTLNKPCGNINMHNESLAAGATVGFTLYNTLIGRKDIFILSLGAGTVIPYNYSLENYVGYGGYVSIYLKNISAGAIADTVVINFAVIKGAIS